MSTSNIQTGAWKKIADLPNGYTFDNTIILCAYGIYENGKTMFPLYYNGEDRQIRLFNTSIEYYLSNMAYTYYTSIEVYICKYTGI